MTTAPQWIACADQSPPDGQTVIMDMDWWSLDGRYESGVYRNAVGTLVKPSRWYPVPEPVGRRAETYGRPGTA